jgi:small subunit ribosomal protein S2
MKITLEQMMSARIHLGHSKRYRHPKISSFIYGVQNGAHVIDLVQTRKQIENASEFVITVASEGKNIIFVGTKTQAAKAIETAAHISQSFFVSDRWLGGMLTNLSTIQASLIQLHCIELAQRNGLWSTLPKKEYAMLRKRLSRLDRYLRGLKGICHYPGVVVIVGQIIEVAAIRECHKLMIPTICRLDTNCNPKIVELGIAINDDSAARILLFLEAIIPRIQSGRRSWTLKTARS